MHIETCGQGRAGQGRGDLQRRIGIVKQSLPALDEPSFVGRHREAEQGAMTVLRGPGCMGQSARKK
jgi:hypothetical protein